MPEDFYDLLEVPPDADTRQIDRAFREKARVYHPDHNEHEQATEQFQVLKKAHEVLSDPEDRATYDDVGHRRYITDHLGGLPGIDVVTKSPEPAPSPPAENEARVTSTAGTTDRTNGGTQQAGPTTGSSVSSGRRRRRRMYRTAPASPLAPDQSANILFGLGLVLYAVGLWPLVQSEEAAISQFVTTVVGEGRWSELSAGSFPVTRVLEYASSTQIGPALAFGVGAILIAGGVFVAGYRIRTRAAWLTVVSGSLPAAVLGLAWLADAGLVRLGEAILQAIGVTVVAFIGAPLIGVLGWMVLHYQARAA